jgi:hypothetical protein
VNKNEAHSILDRIKTDREPMSIFITNEALRLTGDIVGVFDEPLRSDGNESRNHRTSPMENQRVEEGFSYSRYLNCCPNKGVTQ